MRPEELVAALLDAKNESARRALLVPHDPDEHTAIAGLLKDEVDRERLRDPNAASRVAGIAAEVAELAGTPRCRALAAWARANALLHQGEYEECLQLYRQAARFFAAASAEVEAARLTANQAWVLKNLGRYDEGVEAAQEALAILRRTGPSRFLASTWNALATLYRLQGRYGEALAAFARAERIYGDLGDAVQQARLNVNRANALRNLDRFAEAIALLTEARDVLDDHERSLEVARADLNLGIIHTRLGRYDEALAALDRAGKGFAALDNRMEVAVVDLHRADLYAHFNLYEELLQTSARDWRLFKERQMQRHAARALLHRAVAWRQLGDAAQAGELLDEAQATFTRMGDPVWARLAALERAALWRQLGEWERALPLALETAAFLRERGMPLRRAGASLLAAECELALGRWDEAGERYGAVLDLAQALDAPFLRYRARHGLGRVAARQGRLEEAHQHLDQAVETMEGLRQRLRVEEYRLSFLEDKLEVYHDAVHVCRRLGRDNEAFAYVERAKSSALVDLLLASLGHRPPVEGAVDGDLVARLQALRGQLNWQYSKLEGGDGEERGGAPPHPEDRVGPHPEAGVWGRITATEREMVRAWRALQQASPFYASLSAAERCTPSAVGAFVGEDEVFLQYYVAGGTIYAFVVGAEGLRAGRPLDCTPAQIEGAVGALASTLRGASAFEGEYVAGTLLPLARQQLAWLYDDLLAPVVPLLDGVHRLLLAPDGVLFQVPFHALHGPEGYLLDRHEVAYTPSAGTQRLCRENQRRFCREPPPGPALIVGYSQGERLPHVRREVEAVARALPGATVLVDEEATLARLQAHAGRSALLHLAAHGVYRRDNPLFSALQLAGGDWLRVMDLYSLRLKGALVTLSSCETGRHRLLGGDLLGLSRGFFIAGASALVVSLWPVDDVATAVLMGEFYARLAEGKPAAAALLLAQQALRALEEERDGKQVRPYAHPAYWAPFCLLGVPDVRLE